jgi:hypothetical protein
MQYWIKILTASSLLYSVFLLWSKLGVIWLVVTILSESVISGNGNAKTDDWPISGHTTRELKRFFIS